MSGRGAGQAARGRAGRINRGGRSRGGAGRGQHYSGTVVGTLSAALGVNAFDYGQKAATDKTRTSLDKIVQCVGTNPT
jgi:hypothetical protein